MMTEPTTPPASLRPRAGSRKWRQALLAVIIFAGGMACGAGIATIAAAHAGHHSFEHPDDLAGHIARKLASFLNLSDDQTRQVRTAIERRQAALSEIRRDIQPRLEAELSILEADIEAVLDAQQRVKWREHVAQVREQWLPPLPAK